MTQEVQPLTWQKRTNLEEHQQFFSKINEIIANLAPTVDEAEAAIAQANQAVTAANAAIATANAASANADAASQQAQTAANTVAGYDARLTVVEADYLKKTGAEQTVTSQIMVPTSATGTKDMQIANGTRIQNDLAAYEPMIRNTGNQTKSGILTMATPQGIVASATAGYNNILLESSTQYNRLISRVRNVAGDLHDQHFDLGTTYVTTGINNVALRAFAPRETFGDGSENQATLSLSIHVENNDTGYVALAFMKKDGTQKVVRLGTFNGTDWS